MNKFQFEISYKQIAEYEYYEDDITKRDFNKIYKKKEKLLNNALINEISTYEILGLQNSGKSYFVQQFIENNYRHGKTKIFYFSSLSTAEKPEYLDKKNVEYYLDSDFTRKNFNPFEDVLEQLNQHKEDEQRKKDDKNKLPEGKNTYEQQLIKCFGANYKMPEKKENKKEDKIIDYIPFIMIVDDMLIPNNFEKGAYTTIMKTYRHYQCAVLSTTQSMMVENSLKIRKMYETLVTFPNLNQKELNEVYLESSLPITFDEFLDVYFGQLRCKNDHVIIDKRIHPQIFIVNFEGPEFTRKVTQVIMQLQQDKNKKEPGEQKNNKQNNDAVLEQQEKEHEENVENLF